MERYGGQLRKGKRGGRIQRKGLGYQKGGRGIKKGPKTLSKGGGFANWLSQLKNHKLAAYKGKKNDKRGELDKREDIKEKEEFKKRGDKKNTWGLNFDSHE